LSPHILFFLPLERVQEVLNRPRLQEAGIFKDKPKQYIRLAHRCMIW